MNDLFPIFLKLHDRRVLVVGGGSVAAGRIRQLVKTEARVTVIAPRVNGDLSRLAKAGRIELRRRKLRRADLDADWFVILGATNDSTAQEMLVQHSRRRRMLCNVADDRLRSNFFVPALVRRGSLTLAIGTGGRSPYLAGKLRRYLEDALPENLADLTDVLGILRSQLKVRIPRDMAKRKKLIGDFVERVLKK
jgi:precorrin-2 dehydrogenase/sirohydrochlorin ferrochelatase